MGKAGGGRNAVDPRFISMFSVFNLIFPVDDTLRHIYLSILQGHTEEFDEEIQKSLPSVIEMTLNLYKIISTQLPPTPSKFHYIFNLRDLSRITGGLCLSTPAFFPSVKQFVRLWRNEFTRVICDRLINEQDQNLMNTHIKNQLLDHFDEDREYILRNPLLFGDYRNATNDDPRNYEDLLDYDAILFLFKEILGEYNEVRGKMDLVLFEDALEHLTRIHRVLRMYRGHMMIVGVGGSGKQSLTRLASYPAECEIFEISLSRGYNETSFRDDLKVLYQNLGVKDQKTVFLFSDAKVAEEGFLEIINNMLTVGQVPALFDDKDKESIVGDCRNKSQEAG